MESDHRSQPASRGASVGEFRKTRHPRNVKFDKVLETCFSGTGNSHFRKPGTCEASDLRMREIQGSWFGEEVGREHAEARNLELAMARTSEDGRFGNLSGTQFGSHARRHA
jgi:hypothetical protein